MTTAVEVIQDLTRPEKIPAPEQITYTAPKRPKPYRESNWYQLPRTKSDIYKIFVDWYYREIAYSEDLGGWLVFDESCNIWRKDPKGSHVYHLFKEFLGELPDIYTERYYKRHNASAIQRAREADENATTEEDLKEAKIQGFIAKLIARAAEDEASAYEKHIARIREAYPVFRIYEQGFKRKVTDESGKSVKGEDGLVQWETGTEEVDPIEEFRSVCIGHKNNLDGHVTIENALRYIRTDPAIKVDVRDFDAHPEELNTPGGLYNLRTMERARTSPENLVMKSTTVKPDFDGEAPLYDSVLASAYPDAPETAEFHDLAMGATLLGGQYLQKYFYIWGQPGSGKGTLMNVAQGILGSTDKGGYSAHVRSSMFIKTSSQAHPTEYMQFLGARLVVSDELPKGASMDVVKMKATTGGDPITGRYMRQDDVTFEPTHNLWLTSNHMVAVPHDEGGIWRRALILHTPHSVPAEKRVAMLDRKILEQEGSVILGRWMKAAQRLLWYGIEVPHSVAQAQDDYRDAQDTVGQWLDLSCEVFRTGPETDAPLDRAHFVTSRGAREQYVRWCKLEGVDAMGSKTFTQEMKRLLGEDSAGRGKSGSRGFFGVKIEGYIDLDL